MTALYGPPFEMKADPPLGDGCAHCHGRRVTTRNKAVDGTQVPNGVWLAHVEKDPFCSSECCRAFHGCALAGDAAGRCIECQTPFSPHRNSLAGDRCEPCSDRERKRRKLDDPTRCGGCGCAFSERTARCDHCSNRHRAREARRLKSPSSVAAPHLVESCSDSEGGVSGAPDGAATPRHDDRKAA